MPQTDEHLTILDLLRVRSGVVALTKCDLVDDEWLELVREEVAERLKPTTLAGAPIIACSATTGAGLPELLSVLDAALDTAPGRRDLARPRLPIDRVFTVAGFGTVVTGTLQDGRLRVGQEVVTLPAGPRGRIRGLQTHKQAVEEGVPGGRLAVNLAGVAKSDLRRGDVLALAGTLRPSMALDVRIEVAASAPGAIAHNAELEVYAGAAEVMARVLLLDADELLPGASGWAQLRLARPLAVARGDRFILRQPSPSLTVGGGTIVELNPRRHRRRDSAVLARLDVLARGDPAELVLAALRPAAGAGSGSGHKPRGYAGREVSELPRLTGLPPEDTVAALDELRARELAAAIGGFVYAAESWRRLRDDALALLAGYHRQYPLRAGMPREEWRARLGLAPREAQAVITGLVAASELAEHTSETPGRGASLRLAAHEPRPTPEQERAVTELLVRFKSAPFEPPTRAEVERELGAELMVALVERGTLLRAGESLLLEPAAYAEAVRRVVAHLRAHGRLTVAEARDLLGTTRKYMLPILELMDEQHITRRQGDDRVLGLNAPPLDAAGEAGAHG